MSTFRVFSDGSVRDLNGEPEARWHGDVAAADGGPGSERVGMRRPGQIPDISHALSLRELHLTGNQITGQIPDLSHALSLRALYLSGNQITGQIPHLSHALSLRELYLSDNQITGQIPDLSHTLNLRVIDLSENQLHGGLPETIGKLSKLNKLSDTDIHKLQGYGFWSILDISDVIPNWFWNFSRRVMDFGGNEFAGKIPSWIGGSLTDLRIMDHLEVLDLSRNKLSGEIPIGLARLNYLAVLDLSSNFLSGKIPIGTQLQSFNASSYTGNIRLCGDPLPKCSANIPPQNKDNDFQEYDSFLNREFYISIVLGFSFCFWGIVVTLVLKDSWRIAYYEFLNDIKDWLYVRMKIYLVKMQRKLRI
ncbi:receptor-like protein EIX2 [Ipomoea triloba]|uniref:receptor-like protein EIX2 n=1 Tax=Ipomoea triloba TaxID=35885 RepID=UPI00125DBDE5|nr:receptor-like protein EIX2 [Ipomoea triloba]